MKKKDLTRREFLHASMGIAATVTAASLPISCLDALFVKVPKVKPAVSVVKIEDDKIGYAVEKAIDLIGGIQTVTKGKTSIMLKPNLVDDNPDNVTKPDVIKTLVKMMKKGGKEVLIGEGSAAVLGYNVKSGAIYRTRNKDVLDNMQKHVFDTLGYTKLSRSMKVPLVNLHTGDMTEIEVPDGFAFNKITLHRSLADVDMLCSVPMMKTHGLAHVTLGMKNLIGAYPGAEYGSVRYLVHTTAHKVEKSGTAVAIVDMVRANKMGLVVIDGSTAMEGQGPSTSFGGKLLKMNLIIAGTNPLATDMVAAYIMGFEPDEIPTFIWAWKAGMIPMRMEHIDIRGEKLENVKRKFARARISPWSDFIGWFGAQEI